MSDSDTVRVSIEVAVDPATAFAVFTEEVDAWWRRTADGTACAPTTHRLEGRAFTMMRAGWWSELLGAFRSKSQSKGEPQ